MAITGYSDFHFNSDKFMPARHATPLNEMFPVQLKKARKYRRLKQSDLARKLGKHPTSYGKWELGKFEPKFSELTEITKILQFPVEYFFSDSEPEKVIKTEDKQLADSQDKIKNNPAFRRLIEVIKNWDEAAIDDLLNWCTGYDQGMTRAQQKTNTA